MAQCAELHPVHHGMRPQIRIENDKKHHQTIYRTIFGLSRRCLDFWTSTRADATLAALTSPPFPKQRAQTSSWLCPSSSLCSRSRWIGALGQSPSASWPTKLRAGGALHFAIASNNGAKAVYTLDNGLLNAEKLLKLSASRGIRL